MKIKENPKINCEKVNKNFLNSLWQNNVHFKAILAFVFTTLICTLFIITSCNFPSNSTSNNANSDEARFSDVLAEYNTLYKQGNSVAWINPQYVNTNWATLTKPVNNELRTEGYKYLPSEKNDLPTKYCFRDVNDDGKNELIVLGQHYGVIGVYYYDEDSGSINFDGKFCNNTVPMDYDTYTAYLTVNNELVEYAGHNDHAYVRNISQNPSTSIVDYYSYGGSGYADKCGKLPALSNFNEVIKKLTAEYPEDTTVQWINFDGQNGKAVKTIEEWWLTKQPILTGTLKRMTRTEAAQLEENINADAQSQKDWALDNEKHLVLVCDTPTNITTRIHTGEYATGNVTGKTFEIAKISSYSNVPENYFGSETYSSFEGKRVSLTFNEAWKASQAYDACWTASFTGVRCAITDYNFTN